MRYIDSILSDIKKLNGYSYKRCMKSIKRQISARSMDWTKETSDGCTLFEEAVYEGLDTEELLSLFTLFIKYGMDVNYRSSMYGDTYMHTLIEADDYHGLLSRFLYIGYENGFDPFLKNKEGKTIWECLEHPDTSKQLNKQDVQLCFELKSLFEERQIEKQLVEINKKKRNIESELQQLSQEQKILENKLHSKNSKNKIKQKIDDLNA